ncbi:threonine--tRNA ligase [Oceanobacillus jordanicus]|uniref:Threonine--tRNA ligase n=1 Tax=Oceanobacillus jordanicus TaxID=2867266 RepID=A0AAW5B982_9BACI|nr:threonine--tRNA ligase [Oceanobacillus jordanicus]MCG3421000.1 threonine--tRNA ligase [Oceanobacillus jordanicus]
MEKISVQFPDGQVQSYSKGITIQEIAASISSSLAKRAIVGKVDGQLVDMAQPLGKGGPLSILTLEDEEALDVLRHSTAHILAQALKHCFGDVKLGIGPVIEDGFYYDVKLTKSLSHEDLKMIEKEMNSIIKENLEIKRRVLSYQEARKLFEQKGESFKLDILEDLEEGAEISIYQQGEFIDLCRGPHLPRTGLVKAFKLTHVSGAYWKGDQNGEVMQRVYGVAFRKNKELEEYLQLREEAEKRDHRKLGKQLELFMFSEEAPGMPFYLPKGQIIRNELEAFSRELQTKAGYEEVRTPFMMNQRLWEQSGHWDHYKENMYFSEVDNTKFAMKPMNCPGHMLIFKNNLYSYRDLPIRMAEFGQVHRHEYSGALNGMLRVRSFCQDDAHLFVREDQIEEEVKAAIRLVDAMYRAFGFSYTVELSTRPEKSLGSDELWDHAENSLENVLKQMGVAYQVNEGDGAFYGPKIDFHIKDALKRSHQCATIQLDFQMPEKFDLTYINEKGEKERPVVIHRAIYGSIDRFFGILIEHFAGAFPVWLAPVQVQLLPVAAVHVDYCLKLQGELRQQGIRVHIDERNEKLGYRIREAQIKKVPYALVIGDEEIESGDVTVRQYGVKETEQLAFHNFKELLEEQVAKRVL